MGNGLATAAHQDHRRQRLVMQPAFRHEHLRGYAGVMQREITATFGNWRDGDNIDLVEEMFTLTTTVALPESWSSAPTSCTVLVPKAFPVRLSARSPLRFGG